jgi:hypothetical protein
MTVAMLMGMALLPAGLIPEGFDAVQDFGAEKPKKQVNTSKMRRLFANFRSS